MECKGMEKYQKNSEKLSEPPKSEFVILIHGTFAGDTSDTGSNWWQRDSDTWNEILKSLPPGIVIDNVFHWGTGPNSHRARVKAGDKLLNRLLEFERMNTPYHLVGHSHGGNVIGECLRLATLARVDRRLSQNDALLYHLNNLRSWTTVGTPFIDFAPKLPLQGPLVRKPRFKKLQWPKKYLGARRRIGDFMVWFFGMLVFWPAFFLALLAHLAIPLLIFFKFRSPCRERGSSHNTFCTCWISGCFGLFVFWRWHALTSDRSREGVYGATLYRRYIKKFLTKMAWHLL